MAAPLSADRLVSALRSEGVTVVERSGWRTNNRNHKGKWDDLNGVVIHHTAGSNSLSLCFNGLADLPGPLCHTHLAKNGTATMVGYGRANHAGTFAQNAHDAVVAEAKVHPRPDPTEPVDGNRHYYGIEIENLGNGKDPYPEAQYDAAVRWATAICRAHGWTANSIIGHKEGTRRKIDPTFDMDTFRAEVADRLKHPADWTPGDEEDGLSGMTKDDIYNAVWRTDRVPAPDTAADRSTNTTWEPQSYLKDIGNRVRAMDSRLAAQQAAINELVKTVAQLAANAADLDAEALVSRIKSEIEKVTVRLEVTDA